MLRAKAQCHTCGSFWRKVASTGRVICGSCFSLMSPNELQGIPPEKLKKVKEEVMARRTTKKGKTVRRGRAYELTNKALKDLEGQGAMVHAALEKLQPATAAQVAANLGSRLKTKQDPMRVVGFYLSTWKADGYVRVVRPPKPARASSASAASTPAA